MSFTRGDNLSPDLRSVQTAKHSLAKRLLMPDPMSFLAPRLVPPVWMLWSCSIQVEKFEIFYSSIMQPFNIVMKLGKIVAMKYKSFGQMNCSLAQTLEIIGERWTLLILRDAFFGVKRFGHFQRRLGIARNILTSRLNQLLEEDILEKRGSEEGAHYEYVLTSKGLDLQPVLIAMTHWGDKHYPNPKGERWIFVEKETGDPIQHMSVMSRDGTPLGSRDITSIAGPAVADGE